MGEGPPPPARGGRREKGRHQGERFKLIFVPPTTTSCTRPRAETKTTGVRRGFHRYKRPRRVLGDAIDGDGGTASGRGVEVKPLTIRVWSQAEKRHLRRPRLAARERALLALAFPAARRAMRQPLPVQNEDSTSPHASVRLGMLRLGSVRMRGRKVGRVRSERWARKSAKSVRIKARAGGYPRVGFPPLQPGRKRTRAERHAREGAASRAKRTRRVHAETMLLVRTIWTSRCSRRPSPRSLAQSELRTSSCGCKNSSGPSTAKRDGVCLETIQALRLVRNVEGSVSKTRAGCGARARPFGVLCGATLRSHLTRQRQVGKKWVTPALTRHVLAGWSSARFVTQEIPVWRAPSS